MAYMSGGVHLSKVAFDAEAAERAGRRLYMCRHEGRSPDVSLSQIATRHDLDVALQEKYNLRWLTYYVNQAGGTSFCLAEAPSRDAVEACHREAHGPLSSYRVTEVEWSAIQSLLGDVLTPAPGFAWGESPIRIIAIISIVNPLGVAVRLGDRAAQSLFQQLEQVVRGATGFTTAADVRRMDAGVVVSFASARRAVECSLAVIRNSGSVPVRAGLSAGEPLTDGGGLFGATVQVAHQLSLAAAARTVLVSAVVRDLCLGTGLNFVDRGALAIDGIGDMRIYQVGGSSTDGPRSLAALSQRELEVLQLMAKGLSNQEIAASLIVSPNTVARHVANILNKTSTSNRTEAVAFGYRERLINT
jgi:DNA-binding CsgD family transcriptional regulator